MTNPQSIRSLSEVLIAFKDDLDGEHVRLVDILEAFHERGIGFVLFVFAAPMALPLPVPPGINIMMALPLLFLTLQQAVGRHTIWMPEKLLQKKLKTQTLNTMFSSLVPWIKKLEKIIRPRFSFITQGAFSHLIGLSGLIMALSVCIPVRFSKTVRSFGISIMALGVVMRDGLAVIFGAAVGLFWVFVLVALIIVFGTQGIEAGMEFIKGLFF